MIKPNEIRLKRPQWDVFTSNERYRLLVAGGRFGKTFLALVELCRAAWAKDRLVWYVAPTYKQGKRIAWEPLKRMTKPYWAGRPNETDLRIELITGGTIALRGADNFDSLRGDGLEFLVLDEYASMDPSAWTQVLRPPTLWRAVSGSRARRRDSVDHRLLIPTTPDPSCIAKSILAMNIET